MPAGGGAGRGWSRQKEKARGWEPSEEQVVEQVSKKKARPWGAPGPPLCVAAALEKT